MGTRNLTAVMLDGEYKIAQYGQWDGYPKGQGKTTLTFLLNNDLNLFKEILRDVRFITQEEWDEIIENHTDDGSVVYGSEHEEYWKTELAHISRDLGAAILQYVFDGKTNIVKDSLAFAGDSLFCEYAYIIDLDKGTFEIYRGFNKEPVTEGRFLSSDESLEHSEKYEPIALWKEYRLDNLPTEEQFLKDLDESEDE